jgi:hypothetical protein
VRPETIFSAGVAREKLFGLKLLPSIPGYFVGLGLLLTFIGLVIALSVAASSASGNPAEMTGSLQRLLEAATFKFSTSIAGLFSSIALSLVFRTYAIAIESGFNQLCFTIQAAVTYLPPSTIAYRTLTAQHDELQELKQINDVQFFQRIGQAIGPALTSALATAIEPLTTKLDATVGRISDASNAGMGSMIDRFAATMEDAAGRELRELAAGLAEMKLAMQGAQGQLTNSGEDFSRRMMDLAERFGSVISQSATQFSDAKEQAARGLSEAGQEAGSAVRQAMQDILIEVRTQMAAFQSALEGFQDAVGNGAARTAESSRVAAEAAGAAVANAARESAENIRSGLGEVMGDVRTEIDRMSVALQTSRDAMRDHAIAVREAATGSNAVASAFGRVAADVTIASAPLLESSQGMAVAARSMSQAIASAVESLSNSQLASRSLAESLQSHQQKIEQVWLNYEKRFGEVDESLAESIRILGQETTKQQENVARFVREIDEGCSRAVGSLQTIANSLAQNTEELTETLENMWAGRPQAEAAE